MLLVERWDGDVEFTRTFTKSGDPRAPRATLGRGGASEVGVYRTFIFFRCDLSSVSPAVTLWWPGKLPVGAIHYGAMAGQACADFIVACSGVPGAASRGIEVDNLPLRWGRLDELEGSPDTREHVEQWRKWLFEEMERLSADSDGRRWIPILLDLDPPYQATRGGEVLCRRLMDEYREGGPQWVASGCEMVPHGTNG